MISAAVTAWTYVPRWAPAYLAPARQQRRAQRSDTTPPLPPRPQVWTYLPVLVEGRQALQADPVCLLGAPELRDFHTGWWVARQGRVPLWSSLPAQLATAGWQLCAALEQLALGAAHPGRPARRAAAAAAPRRACRCTCWAPWARPGSGAWSRWCRAWTRCRGRRTPATGWEVGGQAGRGAGLQALGVKIWGSGTACAAAVEGPAGGTVSSCLLMCWLESGRLLRPAGIGGEAWGESREEPAAPPRARPGAPPPQLRRRRAGAERGGGALHPHF